MTSSTVTVVLETGDQEVLHLKPGHYVFVVKLVDLLNEYVEIQRCVGNKCKRIFFDTTDGNGVITFEDTVMGLSTITYRFINRDRVFAELQVIPIIIDANEVVNRAMSLLDTILKAILLKRIV